MHVHFVAIAGTGMGSLAGLLKERGHTVTGSDENVYPPMSTALERWGIPVAIGFRTENVLARRPDLVVIGNAVRRENPEARAVLEGGIPYRSFPDALYEHAIVGKHSVVIAGTHGKTTTTSLVATLLHAARRDPSLLVGGLSENFGGSFRDGKGPEFVVEGDEYDTAFFDKTPKFLHYHPETLVVTSIEFDHADIYRDLAHVQRRVREARGGPAAGRHADRRGGRREPRRGRGDGALSRAPLRDRGRQRRRGARARAWARGHALRGARARRSVRAPALLPAWGDYNVANALAALAVAVVRGVPLAAAAAGLAKYRGVKRRQEVRGTAGGVTVVDDFGHHPTAVRETLAALRGRFPGRPLVAVFEPRSNTSRRAIFQREYAEAFDAAARVVVQIVPDTPIYSAFGGEPERLSAEQLARDVTARGVPAVALPDVDAIVDHLAKSCAPGDVVVTLSNGGFGGIWEKLLERLGGGA